MGFLIAQLVKNPPAMQETPIRFLGWEDPLEKEQATHSSILGLPLGSAGEESACKDSLEKGIATHSSILAWRIPWIV